jgi:hypothetical protein
VPYSKYAAYNITYYFKTRSSIKTKTWDVRVPAGRSRPGGQIGALVHWLDPTNYLLVSYSCMIFLLASILNFDVAAVLNY